MEYGRIVGLDKPASRLVLGTMIISSKEPERSFALLDAALEQGGNTFDTAHVYGGGYSERGLGEWMTARGNREQVVLLSKGCHHNMDRKRVTPEDLAVDLYDSLARLQTDCIDIYMLHRDDPAVPVRPIVEAFNAHREAGRIRAFGGSNWSHQRIAEANAYAEAHGLQPFTVSSPNYGLAEQVEDPWGPGCVSISGPQNRAARAWYRQYQMPVFAYSSLARGFFSGRITRENFSETRSLLDNACLTAYCHEVNFRRLDRVWQLAEERGCTVPQLALAYVLSSPLNAFPLVGAATPGEYRENLAAFDLRLSAAERAWLNLESDER